MNKQIFNLRLLALFIVSAVLVAYELSVMRTFAVGSWSNFGAMVISIALLGMGLAGTLLTFFEAKIRAHADGWLKFSAWLLVPAMAAAQIAAQSVPFNPVMIGTDPWQLVWIALYYAIYAVPFFIGAVFIGAIFVELQAQMHRVYFWNMVGSGFGGLLVLGLMYVLPTARLVEPLLILATLAILLSSVQETAETSGPRLAARPALGATALMLLSLAAVAVFGSIKVSEFKPISYARQFADARDVYYSYGPTGEYNIYESSFFHFAPGLSDNASLNVKSMPENAFLGLYIDGQGPIGIMRKLQPDEEAYFDYLPMAAPYLLLKQPNVLLLKLSGDIGVVNALYHQAAAVTVAEPDPTLIHILKDVPALRQYTGDILNDPRVKIYNTEPRAFTAATKQRFDLAEIGLIDSVGLSQTGGYTLDENYTYTTEAINDYLNVLKPDGLLSITVWNRLDPPRNVPKLLTTVVAALQERGVKNPGQHIFVFDSLLSTATILIKNSAFTAADLKTLQQFLRKTSFDAGYYYGKPDPGQNFSAALPVYGQEFQATATNTPPELAPNDLYFYTTDWALNGRANQLYNGYFFNIKPATDNRPYYTGYLKPSTLPVALGDMKDLSEEWGYIFAVATLAFSLLFGLAIILIPLFGRWRELFRRRSGTLRVIIYYAALGVGYMLVEIYLIQRLVFFLANPIFSNAIVITAMLIISGLGALVAERYPGSSRRLLGYAALGITLSMLAYIFLLPLLINAWLGWPLLAKMLMAVIFIAPSAFFLGMPFPTGLATLAKNRPGLIPWAWGMNGALSVTGATLARLLSISWGFSLVIATVIFLYSLAYLVFPGHEAK